MWAWGSGREHRGGRRESWTDGPGPHMQGPSCLGAPPPLKPPPNLATASPLPSPLLHPPTPPIELSAPLRTELLLALHHEALQRVPFLGDRQDPAVRADLAAALKLPAFAPGGHRAADADSAAPLAGAHASLHGRTAPAITGAIAGMAGRLLLAAAHSMRMYTAHASTNCALQVTSSSGRVTSATPCSLLVRAASKCACTPAGVAAAAPSMPAGTTPTPSGSAVAAAEAPTTAMERQAAAATAAAAITELAAHPGAPLLVAAGGMIS